MRVFLVRHGQSAGNADKTLHLTQPDHAIPLTDEGFCQATHAGEFLHNYLRTTFTTKSIVHDFKGVHTPREEIDLSLPENAYFIPRTRMWNSPYLRTRQTADNVCAAVNSQGGPVLIQDRREDFCLVEQQFGLFDGIPDDQLQVRFPAEYAYYEKTQQFEGKFWARMPLGESRFDLAVRVRSTFGTFHRDAQRHGINNIIVVCHGATMRAFLMAWMHYSPEWFNNEPNPHNCAIRLIEDNEDRGYIYDGE